MRKKGRHFYWSAMVYDPAIAKRGKCRIEKGPGHYGVAKHCGGQVVKGDLDYGS